MNDVVRIHSGSSDDFAADIFLDRLPQWPSVKLRKLIKILRSAPAENADAIGALNTRIPEYVAQAKAEEIAARQTFEKGYRNVPAHSRKPEHIAARKMNRLLSLDVHMAKQDLERWTKIQDLFITD